MFTCRLNKKNKQELRPYKTGNSFEPPVELNIIRPEIRSESNTLTEDWFKELAVSVQNTSGKPITHISISVKFPRPENQKDKLDFVVPLDYGESPFPDK